MRPLYLKRPSARPVADGEGCNQLRYRAAGVTCNRKWLGLAAADFGLRIGATGQRAPSDAGTSKLRARNLEAVPALRGVGKKEVAK